MSDKTRKILIIIDIILIVSLCGLSVKLMYDYSSKKEPNKEEEKKNNNGKGYTYDVDETTFENMVYSLPDNFHARNGYEEDGIYKINIYYVTRTYSWNSVIRVVDTPETGLDDTSVLQELLKNNEQIEGSNPQTIEYSNTKVVAFECPYQYEDTTGKMLCAFMPAYGTKLYLIRLTSGQTVAEFIYDYDALESLVNVLLTAKQDAKG